jgi:hypothetical protein
MSFFSKDLYRDVAFQWKGTGFAYLLLLLTICWIPSIVKLHVGLANFVDNEAPKIVSQIPTISIVDGKASIQESQPYYIKDPETGEALVIIDTTGAISSLEGTKAIVLFTKTQATFKENDIETRAFSFGNIDKFTLDQEMISGWLNVARKLAVPVLFPLVVLGSFAFRIVQVLVYAAIGMLFALWCKAKMSYISLIRLAVVAVTPCIIIKTVLGALQVNIPVAGFWYFLIAIGYLFFAVRIASQDEGPTIEST